MKSLSNRERYRRKYLSMYKSVENKMHGENLIWWMSISMRARYSFVFKWRDSKRSTPNPQFKHFLKNIRYNYKVNLTNRRNAVIEHLLK